jgi:hypothetical protein
VKFCNKYNDRLKVKRNERAVGTFIHERASDHVHTYILVHTLLIHRWLVLNIIKTGCFIKGKTIARNVTALLFFEIAPKKKTLNSCHPYYKGFVNEIQ